MSDIGGEYKRYSTEVPGPPCLRPELRIVCRACERDCPAEAIDITSINEAEKTFKLAIYNDRCIHCAQCVDSCPADARQMDQRFEIAAFDRSLR